MFQPGTSSTVLMNHLNSVCWSKQVCFYYFETLAALSSILVQTSSSHEKVTELRMPIHGLVETEAKCGKFALTWDRNERT